MICTTLRSLGSAFCRALLVIVLGAVIVATSSTVSAHPGHGITPDGDSPAHYLLEPMHGLGAVLSLVAIAATSAIVRGRALARRSNLKGL